MSGSDRSSRTASTAASRGTVLIKQSWGAMRQQGGGDSNHPSPQQPRFVRPNSAAPPPNADAFPQLLPSQLPAAAEDDDRTASSQRPRGSMTPEQPRPKHHWSAAGGRRRSLSASTFAEAAAAHRQPPQRPEQQTNGIPKQPSQLSLPSQPQFHTGRYKPLDEDAWQQELAEQLGLVHDWAERDVVHAVLHSVAFDISEAESVLADMVAAQQQQQQQQQLRSPVQSSDDEQPHAAEGKASLQQQVPDAGAGGGGGTGQQDVYRRHRREAVRLSSAWQNTIRRSANAFSSGDHSSGRRLAAEASRLRAQAVEAHSQAATRIEAEMNTGRVGGMYELDLHGLHAIEAVDALQRRLALLDTVSSQQHQSQHQQQQHNRQHDRQKLQQAQARRQLRVIVGRGSHSAGGESSLPRVVEGALLQLGYRYQLRGGAIEVQLRRAFVL